MGTFLVVQWLRLHAPNAKGAGVITGQSTRIPHAGGTAKNKFFFFLKRKYRYLS